MHGSSMFHVYNVSQPPSKTPSMLVSKVASKVMSKVDLAGATSTLLQPLHMLTREEEEYDPHKNRKVKKPTTYSDTMQHLLKACFGAGMLAMPNAMSRLGLVFGSLGIFFLGFIATYCIQILIIGQYKLCKNKKVAYMSYSKTIRVAVQEGPPCMRWTANLFAVAVDFFLLIWQIGVCAIFLVFVGENLRQFVLYCGQDVSVRVLIGCMYPAQVCICMVKDLKMLAPLSTFSNVCNMLGLMLVFYYLIHDSNPELQLDDSKYKLNSLMDIPVFIGITLYAMEAVGVILAIEYNMDNPKEFTGWCGLFTKGMMIIVFTYTGLGIFGFLKYGTECKASITLNLPQHDKKAQAAKLAFVATIFTSFPLQNFVAWQIMWTHVKNRVADDNKRVADMFLRVACSTVPFFMALVAPTLGPFIGLIGSLCLSMVGVLFPAIIDISVFYPNKYGFCFYKLITDIFIILFGIVCCVSGVYTSLLEMADEL